VPAAKTARLKATVRELLGFLRRKAPLAADEPAGGGEEGAHCLDAFSIRETALWRSSLRNFRGPPLPPCAPGGAPSSRISGINSTLCYIQIRAVEFFRYNEILRPLRGPSGLPSERGEPPNAGPLPLHSSLLLPPTVSLVPLTMREARARFIIENCGMCRSVIFFLLSC